MIKNKMIQSSDTFISQLSCYRQMIMGMSICAILFFHQHWIEGGFMWNTFHYWGHFGVDVFFFVSGFGIYHSLHKNTLVKFLYNRLSRLGPVCLFCGVVRYMAFKNTGGADAPYEMLLSLDLWFIQTLIIFYIISPFMYKLVEKYGIGCYIVFLVMCVMGLFFSDNSIVLFSCARFPVYIMGMIVAARKIDLTRNALLFSFLSLFISFLYRYCWRIGVLKGDINNELFTYLFLSVGIIAFVYILLLMCKMFCVIKLNRVFSTFGKCSLEIYLWNEFVYIMVSYYFKNEYPITALIVGLAFSIIFALITHLLFNSKMYLQR